MIYFEGSGAVENTHNNMTCYNPTHNNYDRYVHVSVGVCLCIYIYECIILYVYVHALLKNNILSVRNMFVTPHTYTIYT